MEGETITIRKESLWKYSTFVLAAILIVGAIVFFTKDGGSPSGDVVQNPGQQVPGVNERVEVEIGDSPIKGDKNSKVTMVEFTDYECPFCGRHYQQAYSDIVKNYVGNGKVRIVIKEFPLSFHPEAQKAAEAVHCVREQMDDKGYFEMHDKLFENQQSLSIENEKKWARELGVDGTKFDACLDSGKFAKKVKDDANYGQKIGISGTPGFFINGRIISGACPYATFSQAIESELDGKDWSVSNCAFSLV